MIEPPRIWRSPYAAFSPCLATPDDRRDETITAVDVYDDATLERIAADGFNAIWVHGHLHNIVKTEVFPELGKRSATHLRRMRKLIENAKRHGLHVFLYMQPPQGLPSSHLLWKRHPEAAGHEVTFQVDDGAAVDFRAMCTSTKKVQQHLLSASAALADALPDLGGVILITASERPSHCWGRSGYMFDERGHRYHVPNNCPRCAARSGSDVVVETINLIREGMRSRSSSHRIIAWNWSWIAYEQAPCAGIIQGLPRDVTIMADFERGGSKKILDKRRDIEEYSLSFAGPSAQFRRTAEVARAHGNDVIARLQFGTTHELATVPNLPLIGNLYDKVRGMNAEGIRGYMGCWNFGNMPSANTAAFNRFLRSAALPGKRRALIGFAEDYFPGCDGAHVAAAWLQFGVAMDSYPFSMPFLYGGPVNYALGYALKSGPLSGRSVGRSWHDDRRGDELASSLEPYTLAEVIRGLGQVARRWKQGVRLLEQGLKASTAETARLELDNAWVCYHCFRSTWNTYRTYRLRRNWTDDKLADFQRIVKDELANVEHALPIVARDQRFGYHSEPQAYLFSAAKMRRKLGQLKSI